MNFCRKVLHGSKFDFLASEGLRTLTWSGNYRVGGRLRWIQKKRCRKHRGKKNVSEVWGMWNYLQLQRGTAREVKKTKPKALEKSILETMCRQLDQVTLRHQMELGKRS